MVMTKKGPVVLILAMLVVCFNAYAYGAKSDPARVILSTIYFKNDSVALVPEFENDLKKIQAALEADPAIHLQIEGYGRNHSTPAKNREIAQKRAEAVQQWFVKHGVAASRLEIGNFGGSKPADQKGTRARRDFAGFFKTAFGLFAGSPLPICSGYGGPRSHPRFCRSEQRFSTS
jgi:hypothetical protein